MKFVSFITPDGMPDLYVLKDRVDAIVKFSDRIEIVLSNGLKFNVKESLASVLAKLESLK